MGVLSFTTFCWEQARAFTLSVFLPGAHVHVILPGTRRYVKDDKNKNVALPLMEFCLIGAFLLV